MNIYLLSGESYLLLNEEINKIVGDSKNITSFDMSIDTLDDILIEAGYISLFLEKRYIIVRNANFFGSGKISETEADRLLEYIKNPNNYTTIIFVCNGTVDARKKVTKALKDSSINIPPLKPYEIENRLLNYFKANNKKIDNESIKYIVSNTLNNYDIAMNEANKLVLYNMDSDFIKYSDVINIVSKSINTNNFLFVDAVVEGNLEESFKYLNDLKIMKVEPSILISLLARDFRIMLYIKESLDEKKDNYSIMKDLNLQDWQYQKYLNKIFPYKIKELESILINLANLDLSIKSGKVDRYIGLELFIIDICK